MWARGGMLVSRKGHSPSLTGCSPLGWSAFVESMLSLLFLSPSPRPAEVSATATQHEPPGPKPTAFASGSTLGSTAFAVASSAVAAALAARLLGDETVLHDGPDSLLPRLRFSVIDSTLSSTDSSAML